MADTWIDGAELWFPAEVQLVEIIRFVDRRYLGAITTRRGSPLFYASLMRKPLPDEEDAYVGPSWRPHTLSEAMTDSVTHAREVVLAAYEALSDRLATNS